MNNPMFCYESCPVCGFELPDWHDWQYNYELEANVCYCCQIEENKNSRLDTFLMRALKMITGVNLVFIILFVVYVFSA